MYLYIYIYTYTFPDLFGLQLGMKFMETGCVGREVTYGSPGHPSLMVTTWDPFLARKILDLRPRFTTFTTISHDKNRKNDI